MTTRPECWRSAVIRMYWDDEIYPSVEVPLGDFFCMGWKGEYHPVVSLPVAVNPMGGLNSYWEMSFHKKARITLENLDEIPMILFYQINACLTSVPEDAAQFHAQWRRSNPLPYKVPHTILDGVKGWGQYVGTYLAWGSNNNQWWGEGEIKFFLDGDQEYPTICGTGTEDYFCGAWGFETPKGQYGEFTSPYSGFWCVKTDGLNRSQTRFGMYRWHIMDPVRFEEDIKVTIQALGWRSGGRYLPLQDDIASTAFWYQNEPHAPFSPLPGKDDLEVI
ncbi:MAG TPA: glycoside hydrolase family 172 protein [Anaerolineaceae bacterium]